MSDLHGLGGLTNGENQKGGGRDPRFYRARLFARQTWNLGGGSGCQNDGGANNANQRE